MVSSNNYHWLPFFCTTFLLLIHPFSIAGKSFFDLPISKDPSTNQYLPLIKERTSLDLDGQYQYREAAETSFKPKAVVLPISKDPSTNQYLTVINQRTPLVPLKLTLDLGGLILWIDCEQDYVSSTYTPVSCNSSRCPTSKSSYGSCLELCLSDPIEPKCYNNTCGFLADNQYRGSVLVNAQLGRDVASIQSTDGSNPGKLVSAPKLFFTCSITSMLEGLANGVQGMAGLGWHKLSLPSQFSSAFKFDRKFAMCLTSSPEKGVVIFGDSPYVLLPNIDVSKSLIYTPLISNPVSTGTIAFEGLPSPDYFIGVCSIKINGNKVPLNTTLLTIDEKGYGGTKISTVSVYTVMHTSIYKAVVKSFIKELAQVPRVEAVAPFGACYNSTYIGKSRVGPGVPAIDLVLQSSEVVWRMFGFNSMVEINKDVLCLAFVDGGFDAITSIVIGGHQLEDNLLQFDLAASKLGFSSSLLIKQTTCANFNFTSNP